MLEISSALPDINLGLDQGMNGDVDDDDVYLGDKKNRTPRVSYDREKNNGDLSSIEIYKPYLDDDEEEDDEDEDGSMPYNSERRRVKLDR